MTWFIALKEERLRKRSRLVKKHYSFRLCQLSLGVLKLYKRKKKREKRFLVVIVFCLTSKMTSWNSIKRLSWASLVPGQAFCLVSPLAATQHTKQSQNVKAPATRDLPLIGFVHPAHFLAYRLQKQLKQYANSSLEVKRCPDSCFLHAVHTKHSLCHGCSR